MSLPGSGDGSGPRQRYKVVGWVFAALATVALVVLLVGKVFSGSMATIAGPDSPAIARLHAEAAGRSLAFHLPEVAEEVSSRAVVDSPIVGVVRYKIHTGGSLKDIARIFGMPVELIAALNPNIPSKKHLGPGEVVTVYKHGVDAPPGDGEETDHPEVSVPMPDGKGRKVRRRMVSWGTALLVKNLNHALDIYGDAFPAGPVVIVSDMSRRGGGRLKPHHTHRHGRDVDLSYIPKPEQDNGGFMKMNSSVFDRERNWTLLKALLDTGQVELILMDKKVQKMLLKVAREKGLSDEELGRIFQYPRDKDAEVGIIRHWDGHLDHMHVRFACPPEFAACE